MATVILVRHGRTTANASGVLAGRMPGVKLDETGQQQAVHAGERMKDLPVHAIVSSPLERCRQTAKAIMRAQTPPLTLVTEKGITECDYGEWQGRKLRDLAKEKLWATVQSQPSAAEFPGGESLAAMQARAVAAVRRHDALVESAHGAGAVWVAVSHGDIIKSVLADALGMHLDLFQRINIDPASVSIVRYTGSRPYVLATNTHAGDLAWLAAKPAKKGRSTRRAAGADDAVEHPSEGAVVGGGAGPSVAP